MTSPSDEQARLDFHHALLYVDDLERSLAFYKRLGLDVVASGADYVRLRFPGGHGTIAIHEGRLPDEEPGAMPVPPTGVRLYFEAADVEAVCDELRSQGIELLRPPETMPWGWVHAYLRDPDGHELSVFRAGADRIGAPASGGDADTRHYSRDTNETEGN